MTDLSLEHLRQAIDEIDDQLHDLLLRRVDVVAPMAALKATDPGRDFVRPAREAEILRRLVARHKGPLPAEVIVRLWRELISAKLGLQGAFSVHVFGGGDGAPNLDVWDVARAYYGATTPMTLHQSAQKLVRTVSEMPGALGVMPLPAFDDTDPAWWSGIMAEDAQMPRIIARIPFLEGAAVGRAYPPAYVLGCVEPAETGDDVTVLALIADHDLSRTRVQSALEGLGLTVRVVATREEAGAAPLRHYLCEADGFLQGTEADLATRLTAASQGTIRRVVSIGAFARPVVLGAPT